jgi:hypothetical protein
MLRRKSNATLCCMFVPLLALAGCSQGGRGHHKKCYGQIYHGTDGNYYTRSYDDGELWYWVYVDASSSSSSSVATRSTMPSFSSGSWTRISTTPTGLIPTSKVVEEEDGKPTQEVEDEGVVADEETITESTTESDVASLEADSESDASDSASDSDGGSSSSDSGGDSGGDASGGDGGGGENNTSHRKFISIWKIF